MEAQMERPSHHQDQDPQNTALHPEVMEGEGEGEQQQQQHHHKSVLKKVKDKAKKIKDTIKKHGHGHDNNEDSDEEMATDHEVHGAPMCESTVVRSVNLPKEANPEIKKRIDDTQTETESTPDKPDPARDVSDESGSNPQPGKKPETNPKSNEDTSKSENTIAAKISSAASAVAGKAASAKNAVASKLGYGYLAEKLRPGDEDRGLSEAITDSLSKKKGNRGEEKAMGKVTESSEVAARLGRTEESKREGEDAVAIWKCLRLI